MSETRTAADGLATLREMLAEAAQGTPGLEAARAAAAKVTVAEAEAGDLARRLGAMKPSRMPGLIMTDLDPDAPERERLARRRSEVLTAAQAPRAEADAALGALRRGSRLSPPTWPATSKPAPARKWCGRYWTALCGRRRSWP
jgi:hypothetical protein